MEDKIFGKQKRLSRTDYNTMFESTGLDIDGRKNQAASMMPFIEKKVESFIMFAQTLPGYTQLTRNEQKSLSRGMLMITSTLELNDDNL